MEKLNLKIELKNKTSYLSLINLGLALFIILWGAWVRMSGSGAGCGDHWPLCNGEVIPLAASVKTLIEFIHRLTSGFFGITILLQVFFSFKEYSKNSLVKKFSLFALFFTLTESLIGAVLVKKGLVVDNASGFRAFVIGFHLINTFFLMGSLIASYFYSRKDSYFKRPKFLDDKFFYFILFVFLITSAMGAITALGNTLFPESSLIEGFKNDFDIKSHFAIRLRVFHPLFALILSFLLFNYADKLKKITSYYKSYQALIIVSVLWGVINWLLLAPVWGALVHLFLANFLWLGLIYLYLDKLQKD